jgi:dihydroxyacetone kinase phosphotransfer subunit
MVALVLVSHSRELGASLARLVEGVSTARIPLAVAAGVAGGPGAAAGLGTDALAIEQAIRSVSGPDGVVVLMDLGSAVLAAETALELLPEEVRSGVRLSPAPLVEGAIAAAVSSAAGGGLDEVLREAAQALAPKMDHLAAPEAPAPRSTTAAPRHEGPGAEGPFEEVAVTVRNAHGLHLRPAARLVNVAARFRAEVLVFNPGSGKPPVSASSLNGLTTLGLAQGDPVVFRARGPEARAALDALRRLAQEHFGEPPAAAEEGGARSAGAAEALGAAQPPAAQPPAGQPSPIQGIPVSEGFAAGPLVFLEQATLEPSDRPPQEPEQEWALLQEALDRESEILERERQEVSARVGPDKGALFEAFRLILQDSALLGPLREAVFVDRLNAEQALARGIRAVAGGYQDLADPYSRQRGADILDLGRRVLRRLLRAEDREQLTASAPVLLAARELSPAAAARLDARVIQGVLSVRGGPTSHSAVLVRSLGIPCVTGLPESLLRLPEGTVAALDGAAGRVWVAPDAQTLARIEAGRAQWLRRRAAAAGLRREPAVSRDGRRFEVEANIAAVTQAQAAVEQGAEGVGVLRTEFLFLGRKHPPAEEEQLEVLGQIATALRGRPLTVRTLDIGGDKEAPYLALPAEANPYLGVRGIRLSLRRPELFQDQLRAVLRAAQRHDLRLLFPMISTREELDGALAELGRRDSPPLAHTGRDHGGDPVGCPVDPEPAGAGRFREPRHQRPDAVHPGRRARQPGPGRPRGCPAPGRAGPGAAGGRRSGAGRQERGGVRGDRRRPGRGPRAGRPGDPQLQPEPPRHPAGQGHSAPAGCGGGFPLGRGSAALLHRGRGPPAGRGLPRRPASRLTPGRGRREG